MIRKPLKNIKARYLAEYTPPQSQVKSLGGTTHEQSSGAVQLLQRGRVQYLREMEKDETKLPHREHIRTVFKEFCEPLHDIFDMNRFSVALVDVCRGDNF